MDKTVAGVVGVRPRGFISKLLWPLIRYQVDAPFLVLEAPEGVQYKIEAVWAEFPISGERKELTNHG